MKYEINRACIVINDYEAIEVGVVLGPEDDPQSPSRSEIIPISEFEKGLKSFKYGHPHINDLCGHWIGNLYTYGEPTIIDKKWIDELSLMGYDVSVLKYKFQNKCIDFTCKLYDQELCPNYDKLHNSKYLKNPCILCPLRDCSNCKKQYMCENNEEDCY